MDQSLRGELDLFWLSFFFFHSWANIVQNPRLNPECIYLRSSVYVGPVSPLFFARIEVSGPLTFSEFPGMPLQLSLNNVSLLGPIKLFLWGGEDDGSLNVTG